jgi:transposase-like protein
MVQQALFPTESQDDKRISIGNGFAIEWLGKSQLTVYRYGIPYKICHIKEAIDRRTLVVELVLECGVTKSRLAEALDISRQSIDNWVDTFKRSGREGLINSYKGSRRKGRQEHAQELPIGNKARQLEAERRRVRQEALDRQMSLPLEEPEPVVLGERPEIFNETHEFQESRYAGSFLYWGIFQRFFDFMSCCESYLGRYGLVIYLFAMMMIHNLRSVEQLKTVYRREFGRILGLKQLFSKEVLWEKIHQACAQKVSLALVEEFFKRQAQLGLVSLWCIYIDGHFIPYYGKERVRSGYYTQRGQMMPGQTEMFAHDGQGRIVYFELQEGQGDLKAMMRKMSEKWASYIGGKAPLIVVDRETWGVEHFLSLKGYRFVTWEKYTDPQELAAIPEGRFGEVFWVNNKEYQALEEKKLYHDQGSKHSIELRRIIIWNKGSDHRVACVTQDDQEDTITIACAMLGRWGISENGFKHMGDRLNMHYNPLLELEKESQRQDVANPRHKELQKKVKGLKKRLNKCERDLGRLPLRYKKDGTLRMSKRRQGLQEQQKQLKIQLTRAQEELEGCPERIDLSEVKEEKFKEIGTEGKNLWDLAQSLVWNSRKKLIELFANFLPNPRDLIPVLEAITRCHGWIKTTPEAVLIRLEPLEVPRFQAAQIQLCQVLNQMGARLSNGKILLYEVGERPKKMSKK